MHITCKTNSVLSLYFKIRSKFRVQFIKSYAHSLNCSSLYFLLLFPLLRYIQVAPSIFNFFSLLLRSHLSRTHSRYFPFSFLSCSHLSRTCFNNSSLSFSLAYIQAALNNHWNRSQISLYLSLSLCISLPFKLHHFNIYHSSHLSCSQIISFLCIWFACFMRWWNYAQTNINVVSTHRVTSSTTFISPLAYALHTTVCCTKHTPNKHQIFSTYCVRQHNKQRLFFLQQSKTFTVHTLFLSRLSVFSIPRIGASALDFV